ncbi:MAG: hypothetical protein ACI8RD_013789, partial [Bacillariaceae sp.]
HLFIDILFGIFLLPFLHTRERAASKFLPDSDDVSSSVFELNI